MEVSPRPCVPAGDAREPSTLPTALARGVIVVVLGEREGEGVYRGDAVGVGAYLLQGVPSRHADVVRPAAKTN